MRDQLGLIVFITLLVTVLASLAVLETISGEKHQLNEIIHQQSLELEQIQHTNDVLVEICSAQYRKAL